jgi:hypothetical protein
MWPSSGVSARGESSISAARLRHWTITPDWQWFDEVQHAARAAFVVHTGGSVDDEHGGWAGLFNGVAQSLMQARDEHRAARAATERLADRCQRVLAPEDGTYFAVAAHGRGQPVDV